MFSVRYGILIFMANVFGLIIIITQKENSDVLIWVENALKKSTTILVLKMFSLCLNQVKLTVFTLYISTNKLLLQSVVYSCQKVVK